MLPAGGAGFSLGAAVANAAKTRSTGANVGRAAGKATSSRSRSRSSGGSSGRRSSSGGGSSRSSGGGRSSSGGGGGSYSPPKRPSVPSINSYLGTDSVYQGALSGSKRTLADFLSELGRRRGEAGTQFTQTKAGMERDRTQQLEDLRNEFASRGMIQSGLYGEEQGRFQQQFAQQLQALEQQQAGLMADLLSQETNYRREQQLALEAARQEALQRRAAKFNIGG